MTEPLKCPLCDAEMPHTPLQAAKNSRDDQTHIYICEQCPGILIEWWDETDTEALMKYFKNPKENIDQANLLKLAKGLSITTDEVKKAAAYFEKEIGEFFQMLTEGNVISFTDYDEFFTWIHEDMSAGELIQLLANETNAVNDDQVFECNSGATVFLYK